MFTSCFDDDCAYAGTQRGTGVSNLRSSNIQGALSVEQYLLSVFPTLKLLKIKDMQGNGSEYVDLQAVKEPLFN